MACKPAATPAVKVPKQIPRMLTAASIGIAHCSTHAFEGRRVDRSDDARPPKLRAFRQRNRVLSKQDSL
ncbi:hypothetical protein WS62_26990 [Burkholderia sp. ABCPW 14]|uniref:Uncharacterized protein n=2 Tax=Burkholderiaceae TaxID=119060 RepID=A0A1B4FU32_9BURK|nr:hypothetical protein WS71_07495 [Burkholderia mayonis]KVD80394.1 hypothetical protein WS62_26990 [Burkholderia sp. ABCPW 14]KVE52568.1 hypothetical protein WS71_09110 [Burkholderia mayonis]